MTDRPSISGLPRWAKIAVVTAAAGLVALLLFDKILMPALVHSSAVVVVPDYVGHPSAEAIADLKAHGFTIAQIDTHADERYPAGSVLYQSPYGGAQVKEARKIFLIVSSGKELQAVPNVAGLPLREAKIRLQMAGLNVGDVVYESNATIPEETVLRQNGAAGSHIAMGATITLTISSGPATQRVAVPSLTGRTFAEAQAMVLAAKLVFGTITYKPYHAALPSTVLEQQPAAGDTVNEGTSIQLVVAGE